MVDLLKVNRRSTEIPFPFIYLFLYFFHKERKARSGGGGGGGGGADAPVAPPVATGLAHYSMNTVLRIQNDL